MLPRSRSGALVAALALGLGILGVVDAAAAPPRNDDFRDARAINALPFAHRTDTHDASTESTDPYCRGRKRSVWYSFTAPEAGWVVGSTAGSNYDTTLGVYTGTRRNLTRVKCDDDSGPRSTSLVFFRATAGEQYHFMVASHRLTAGRKFRLVFGVESSPSPCFGRVPTIVGTPGDDVIEGTPGNDVISGLAGNDTIVGNGGSDRACGHEGTDTIERVRQAQGNEGDDSLTAPPGQNAELLGGDGNDTLVGGFGGDYLNGGQGDDVLWGHEGNDYLEDPQGGNELYGGQHDDVLVPGRGTGVIVAGAGFDLLDYDRLGIQGIAIDLTAGTILVEGIFAQTVDEVEYVIGTPSPDTFMGSDGDDWFEALGGADTMDGSFGSDFLVGGRGDDIITGSSGDDRLWGSAGSDSIWGSEGDDSIDGEHGNDQLSGDTGDDYLAGGSGDDNLDGGDGVDGLNGGRHSDSCVNGERIINCE